MSPSRLLEYQLCCWWYDVVSSAPISRAASGAFCFSMEITDLAPFDRVSFEGSMVSWLGIGRFIHPYLEMYLLQDVGSSDSTKDLHSECCLVVRRDLSVIVSALAQDSNHLNSNSLRPPPSCSTTHWHRWLWMVSGADTNLPNRRCLFLGTEASVQACCYPPLCSQPAAEGTSTTAEGAAAHKGAAGAARVFLLLLTSTQREAVASGAIKGEADPKSYYSNSSSIPLVVREELQLPQTKSSPESGRSVHPTTVQLNKVETPVHFSRGLMIPSFFCIGGFWKYSHASSEEPAAERRVENQ